VLALRSPPGSANIFQTCRIPPDVRSERLAHRHNRQKKKKERRNYRFGSVRTNVGRSKDINRCPLSGVSGVRVRTYIVLRAYKHIYIYIYTYILLCVYYTSAADFRFRGEKLCKVKCARRIQYMYIRSLHVYSASLG